jgi:hypothetical protein
MIVAFADLTNFVLGLQGVRTVRSREAHDTSFVFKFGSSSLSLTLAGFRVRKLVLAKIKQYYFRKMANKDPSCGS